MICKIIRRVVFFRRGSDWRILYSKHWRSKDLKWATKGQVPWTLTAETRMEMQCLPSWEPKRQRTFSPGNDGRYQQIPAKSQAAETGGRWNTRNCWIQYYSKGLGPAGSTFDSSFFVWGFFCLFYINKNLVTLHETLWGFDERTDAITLNGTLAWLW